MTVTLADLAYEVANALNALRSGTATGGSVSTIVDAVYRDEDDDYFNQGTAWILQSTDGLAPQGEMRAVSDFDGGTNTVTVADDFSAAVEDGDVYALEKGRYELPLILDKINAALRRLGSIPQVDTSITTASDQSEYTLPTAANFDLRGVYIQRNNDDADDNRWVAMPNVDVEWSNAAGGSWTIRLPFQPATGYKLLLEYTALHPRMYDEGDELYDSVHPDRVVYEAALHALQHYRDKIRSDEFEARKEDLSELRDRAEVEHPIPLPTPRMRKIAMPWGGDRLRGFGNTKYLRQG